MKTKEKFQKKAPNNNKIFNIVLLLLAISITLFSVLTGAFLYEAYDIRVDSLSPKLFRAPKVVTNEIATKKLQNAAMESVVTLYKYSPEINDLMSHKLETFFDEVSEKRYELSDIYSPYDEEDSQSGDELSQMQNIGNEDYNFENISIFLSEDQYIYLIELDSMEYNDFKTTEFEILSSVLEIGIKEEFMAKSLAATEDEFDDLDWDMPKKKIGIEVIASILEPNLIADEEATKKAKEEKAAEVEPVVYFAGQNIVDKNDIITPEIYVVLDSLGYTQRSLSDSIIPVAGTILIVIILFGIMTMYIYYFNEELKSNRKEALLLFSLYILCIVSARIMIDAPYQFVPIILFTMLISLLIESRLAMIVNLMLTIICAITVNGDISFIIYFLSLGTFSAIIAKYTTDRSKTFPISILVSIVSGIITISIGFLYEKSFSNELMNQTIYSMLNGLLTVVLCIGTLPLWETVFGVVTTIKMLDLMNPNNKLLRRLTIEAPGTYQHSLLVGNLAETAAFDIGADPTLARLGGYYHDIGKLEYPQYYSENQLNENPHDELDPYTSAKIIIGHVTKGVEMAKEAKLPKKVIDITRQHHGNTLIKYFYYKATKMYPESEISEDAFRYNYDIPDFKESAIVMLADTIEAAVRSMAPSKKDYKEIEVFVRALVKDKLDDGQLLNSMLTIKDLDTIVNSFMRVFKSMYHQRVAYPKSTMAEIHSKEGKNTAEKLIEDEESESEKDGTATLENEETRTEKDEKVQEDLKEDKSEEIKNRKEKELQEEV